MKKWMAAFLSVIMLTALMAVPASAATQGEFERLGIDVMQEAPDTLPLTYVVYDPEYPDDFLVKQGELKVGEAVITPSAKEGYVDITQTVWAYLEYENYYTASIWSNGVLDYYTGVFYNFGGMEGDLRRDIVTPVRFNGRNYKISCAKTNTWHYMGWQYYGYDDEFYQTEDVICESTMTFTVPEAYNGLVYGLHKQEIVGSLNYSAPSGEEIYIEKEDAEDAVFFRFANGISDTELTEVNTPLYISIDKELGQLDNGISYEYTITNYTDKPMRGCYALLAYSENEDGTLLAEFFNFDVNLAPEESVTNSLNSCYYGLSQRKLLWVEFDSKAERDAFYADSKIDNTDGTHYTVDCAERAWLEAKLGTAI